ncbi:MAG: c-type cytochrome [Acidobacteriaceae bacterium]
MRGFLLGLIIGIIAVPLGAFFYLHYGHPPVAVADPSFPLERQIVDVPLQRRIDQEAPSHSPIEPSETNLLLGAQIYRDRCSGCHGFYGQASPFGKYLFPQPPQLWAPHGNGVVGVSDDPPGNTYWVVKNGIRLSGMPEFRNDLNETQIWQVALLLSSANKPLPADVLNTVKPVTTQPAVP